MFKLNKFETLLLEDAFLNDKFLRVKTDDLKYERYSCDRQERRGSKLDNKAYIFPAYYNI